ncbi:hypothetical protein [Aquiflexum lacus]|uniref:hypothetical protein n=1 Tax=Aquiflexum lacus TaxID=2483805 RepID=UPI00189442B6|nr:hypothetical protein [Aquiflexum lacus]
MSTLDKLEGKQEHRIDPDANPLLSVHDEEFTDALIEGVCKEEPKDQTEEKSLDGNLKSGQSEDEGKKVRVKRKRRGIH